MRPLNLGETLDASIKIVRRRWQTLAVVMILVALPIQLLDVLVITATTDTYDVSAGRFTTDTSTNTTYSDESAYIGGQVVIQLLSLVGYVLGTVACYRVIADAYLGGEATVGDSLRFAARRVGATLWLSLLLILGLIGAFIAFVIPGIWLLVAWSVAFPVMLVEGTGGANALGRSYGLVKGRWWATFGRLAVAYILVSVVTIVVTAVAIGIAVGVVDETSFGALVLEHAANFLVSLVTTPFIAAVTTLVYFDLRVRKEGFDLALLAEPMGGAAASGPAPGRTDERDAFGHPIAPGAAPSAPASVPPPAPGAGGATSPGGWAPPVAPEPRRPPSP
jgi:hypothetical protein